MASNLLAVIAAAVDQRAPQGWAGLIIGLAVASAILVIVPLTGGSLNPARTFGPNLVQSIFGGDVEWSQFPLYVIGPVIDSSVGLRPDRPAARPRRVGTSRRR